MYEELSSAQQDRDFKYVRMRLQSEWLGIGAFLIELVTVDATIFAISPDAAFKIRSYAYLAVVISSMASALGIVCVTWFHLRYRWIGTETFIIRARDVYGTYFFFSLSSRVPAFCTLVSSVSLTIFLALVAYDTWPEVVLVLGITVVFGMCLQFPIYAAHRFITHLARGFLYAGNSAHAMMHTTASGNV